MTLADSVWRRAVLGLLINESSNAEIARAMVVAPRTVAVHLEHDLAKLSAWRRQSRERSWPWPVPGWTMAFESPP